MCGCFMHKQFLLKALEQAWLGRGSCFPNPSVGAIAVQNNVIIAQAWHQGAGMPHAEKLLLDKIPKNSKGVSLYVTLEPCNHWGKTPPCVNAIINHGIDRVVYAFKDPNPVVAANNTPELLKKHKIDAIYCEVPEVTKFYESYQHWVINKTPWITAKIAQTFDGKIAGANSRPIKLSNDKCSEFTHLQRFHTDIILTSAKTINIDNPSLNARFQGEIRKKHVAIIDTRLEVNKEAWLFEKAECYHIFYDASLLKPKKFNNCRFHGVSAENGQLDLKKIIYHLGSMGYHDVWVEAGGGLFSSLHHAKLVNRTYIYLVPMVLGSSAVSAYRGENFLESFSKISWWAEEDNMIAAIDWDISK